MSIEDTSTPTSSSSRLQRYADWAVYAVFIVIILGAPMVIDDVFWLNRISKYLVFGMLGIAIALSWGYAGILNLGQGLFFGLGAYMTAMSLKLMSATSLQQGSDKPVPDFMLWNAEPGAVTDLCCINKGSFLWIPFQSQWFGMAMSIVIPLIVAFVLSSSIFRLRVSGVYVAIITLALVLLVRLLLIDAQPITNGFNGLTDLGWLTIGGFEFDPYMVETYYVVAISLTVVLLLGRWLVSTRAGLILQSTRDDPTRARYLGYDVAAYQIFFFTISAGIAGFAGLLYVVAAEFASPSFMDIGFSISMVVWAAVGGRNSLIGACIGAILINTVEATVSETEIFKEAWKLIIGGVFVLVVLYMPNGLAGIARDLLARFERRRKGAPAETAPKAAE
ncbi:urea ABC transporter permease subunit UrtC [Thioclava pacifica]|uniref:Urea ABC transporter permease n=1 Tax=Thioclava pacifica DSM 10166 TaxID=1353537 RepID=A0A074JBN6_9RHOB|nr:urea ABC transporter permease subunit UrtC [Thioclava pacifica]KEO55046.1 urea ABC transporter permease [Thioclava pacifica DSM 10166]